MSEMSEANLTQQAGDTRQDALAPAAWSEIFSTLKSLPSRPGLGWVFGTVIVFLVTLAAMTGGSQLLGFLVDIIKGQSIPVFGGGPHGFAVLVTVVGFSFLLEAAGRALAGYLVFAAARRLSVDLRRECLDSALRAPVPDIMELGTGNVITRLTKDIDTTVRISQFLGVRLVITVLMFPFTFVALSLISWHYLLLVAGLAMVFYPSIKSALRLLPTATNILSTSQARRNNMILDTVRGMPTIRALGLNSWATKRLEKKSWETVQAEADRRPIIVRMLAQGYAGYTMFLVLGIALSAYGVHAGGVSLGQAAAAIILIVRMEIHVFNVLFFAGEIQNGATALGRAVALARLSDGKILGEEPADLVTPPEIVIDDLTYTYPGGTPILEHINLTLAAGTVTALVGESGAGKSTLAGVIAGLQRPTAGRILVGGVDTATVPDTWTTRQVLLASQEVHLFSGTLREDLTMAKPDASDAELVEALGAAGLPKDGEMWIRWLPEGLDTFIGAGNNQLAPEIAQHISLARIKLLSPPVLILDEATSEAGSDVGEALDFAAKAIVRGRTSLVVAHRLDQAIVADRILLMEDGTIIEDGTHDELMQLGGRYARLFERWRPDNL